MEGIAIIKSELVWELKSIKPIYSKINVIIIIIKK